MPVVTPLSEPTFRTPNAAFTPMALPRLGGSEETLVCRVVVQPGTAGPEHQVTRHQVYAVLSGSAVAHLDGERHPVGVGDTLVVPPGTAFALEGTGEEPFEAMICSPVGLEVVTAAGTFPPPWSALPED